MQGLQKFFGDMFTQEEQKQQEQQQQQQQQEDFQQVQQQQQPKSQGWLSGFGKFGFGGGDQKKDKNFKSCMKYMEQFQGKGVIITGSTGGIGSKVTKKLLKCGAKVVALVQDQSKIEASLQVKDRRLLQNLIPITLNLREPYQIEKKFRMALNKLQGKLDIMILCHGYIKEENIYLTNMLEWDQMMNLNVRPSFQLLSLSLPFLKLSKGNAVVLSSTAGVQALPGSIIYSTSMAMLNSLVKCTALESSYFGVRCNAVAAGITNTQARTKKDSLAFSNSQNKQFLNEAAGDVPLFRQVNQPGEVANCILWLASSDASFVTGEIMVVDGGQQLTTNKYEDFLKQLDSQKILSGK